MTLQEKIIQLLSTEQQLTITEIAKKLNVAYSHAHTFTKKLQQQNIITTKKIGQTTLCQLNLKEPQTRTQLANIEYKKTQQQPNTKQLQEKIEQIKQNIFCAILNNKQIILITTENTPTDTFTIFKNRKIIHPAQIKNLQLNNPIILYGAETYWSLKT